MNETSSTDFEDKTREALEAGIPAETLTEIIDKVKGEFAK